MSLFLSGGEAMVGYSDARGLEGEQVAAAAKAAQELWEAAAALAVRRAAKGDELQRSWTGMFAASLDRRPRHARLGLRPFLRSSLLT